MKLMPQEIMVRYVLPGIRKGLSIEFQKKRLKQKEIAKLLNITPAAVSQYLKQKRGSIEFNKKIESEIKKSANIIIKDPTSLEKEIFGITRSIKESGFICEIHKKYDKVPLNCEICFVK
jgi:predicted transcriptional regulator